MRYARLIGFNIWTSAWYLIKRIHSQGGGGGGINLIQRGSDRKGYLIQVSV